MERCGRRRDSWGERRGDGGGIFVFFFFMYCLYNSQMFPSLHFLLSFSSYSRVMWMLCCCCCYTVGKVRNSMLANELVEVLMACMWWLINASLNSSFNHFYLFFWNSLGIYGHLDQVCLGACKIASKENLVIFIGSRFEIVNSKIMEHGRLKNVIY